MRSLLNYLPLGCFRVNPTNDEKNALPHQVLKIWRKAFSKNEPRSSRDAGTETKYFAMWYAILICGFVIPFAEILYAARVTHTVPRDSIQKILFYGFGTFVGIRFAVQRIRVKALNKELVDSATKSIEEAPLVTEEEKGWDGFDQDASSYPEELDIALQAWRAISLSEREGPVKEQLVKWIRDNYPDQSTNSVERIATVANWDKTGGRPKSTI